MFFFEPYSDRRHITLFTNTIGAAQRSQLTPDILRDNELVPEGSLFNQPGMRPDHENALENENLELKGGGWTTMNVNSRTSSEVAYSNLFDPGQGSIICDFNDKVLADNHPHDRLEWSQVMSTLIPPLTPPHPHTDSDDGKQGATPQLRECGGRND